MKAGEVVNKAITGDEFKTVIVNGKAYTIYPPTIHRISGAAKCLTKMDNNVETVRDVLMSLKNIESAAKALSWFIQDDEGLSAELVKGTFDEIVDALDAAYSLVSAENFFKLSALAKNLVSLTAKQKL